MSDVSKDKAFDRAIDLVINQDHVAQQWTGRYIAVQTSLAIAASAFLSWKGSDLGFLALALLLGVIAIIFTNAITAIITREYEWQKRYVEMVRRTEGDSPFLYQAPGAYQPLLGKDIPGTYDQIRPWVVRAWVLFIVLVVLWTLVIACQQGFPWHSCSDT